MSVKSLEKSNILIIFLFSFLCFENSFSSAKNVNSYFDLTPLKNKEVKAFSLKGKWFFVWGKLVTPESLLKDGIPKDAKLKKVPLIFLEFQTLFNFHSWFSEIVKYRLCIWLLFQIEIIKCQKGGKYKCKSDSEVRILLDTIMQTLYYVE